MERRSRRLVERRHDGSAEVGGVLQFRFPAAGFDIEVLEQQPSERVTWKVVEGPEEWVGTTID